MKILIVEDEIVSRRFLEAILRKLDHSVTSCSNGAEAWEAFQKHPFQIVICDWMMPVMDGIELCRRIRTRRRSDQCYFIMLTSRAGSVDMVESLAAGADEHLSKPLDAGKLREYLGVAMRLLAAKTTPAPTPDALPNAMIA